MSAEYMRVYHGTRIRFGIRQTRIFYLFPAVFELCVLSQVFITFTSSLLTGKAARQDIL